MQFPNVIGAVDCTHIRLKRPSGPNEADFVNRKGFHSLNVQVLMTSFSSNYIAIKTIICL